MTGEQAATLAASEAGVVPEPQRRSVGWELTGLIILTCVFAALSAVALGRFANIIRAVEQDLPARILHLSQLYAGLSADAETAARLTAVMTADPQIDETQRLESSFSRLTERMASLRRLHDVGAALDRQTNAAHADAKAWMDRARAEGSLAAPRTLAALTPRMEALMEAVAAAQSDMIADAERATAQQQAILGRLGDQVVAFGALFAAGIAVTALSLVRLRHRAQSETHSRAQAVLEMRRRFVLQERYARMFRENHAMQLLIDRASGRIVDANPAAQRRLADGAPLVGRSVVEVFGPGVAHPDGCALCVDDGAMQAPLADGRGEVELHVCPILWDDASLLYAIGHDVTDRNRLMRDLERLAATDPLTGAANRRSFFSAAQREAARARRHGGACGLIALDVDFFKRINDRFGHGAGDAALIAVVATLKQDLRDVDLVGRLGGEEFALLLPDADLAGAVHVAERCRRRIADLAVPHPDDPALMITVTASFGVVSLTDGGAEAALARADAALYRAKERGRNRVEVA